MAALILATEELIEITGRKRSKEQQCTLTQMGIRWQVNAAGHLIVGRKHVEDVLAGEQIPQRDRKKPNLQALSA